MGTVWNGSDVLDNIGYTLSMGDGRLDTVGRKPDMLRENDVAAETHSVNRLQQTKSSVIIIIVV
jgi:hypothetical protein